jgi:predicted ATPase/DNA-binding CsgD family transcriptional regulator
VGIHRDIHGPFIGRDDEVASLTQLRRDSHRYGRFVLIAGEPGIGKSRLVNEFLRDMPRGRAAIGIGRALEHVRSPFAPWISALEAASPAAARAVRPNGPGFDDKAAMYDTVVSALRESALRRSTILVLEDLHWADAGSLDLLHVLLSEISSLRRLLVIGTVRSSEAHETVSRIFTNPQAVVLELRPLASRECIELVRSLVRADDVAASRVERIATLSGGNPFFASELSKSKTPGDIPLTLSSAIESRIASLRAEEMKALEAAAVLGEEFELELLADIVDCSTAEAAERLESAQRGGIVGEDIEGHFRFAHALTRAILASHVTSAQRIDLHRRAARALERRQRFDAFGFAQLAYHHAGAHNREKAYGYQMRAGGLAYNVHAYADAATFYGDAAACADPGSLERARALARQGDALLRSSVVEDAERAYTNAIAIYRSAGSIEEAAGLYQSLSRSLYNQDRVRDALTLIQHAIAELTPLPAQLNDELTLQAAFYAADIGPELSAYWLDRIDERTITASRSGGLYYQIKGAVQATQGDAEGWKRSAEAFQKNVSMIQPDGHYVGYFGNVASNALFLGLPAMALYERCFALARTLKMEFYEAAYASHAAFERWLHGDDESFARYAALAATYDTPAIPALHAYVLLADLLGESNANPPAREVDAIVTGGHNEFFGPLVGVFARKLARSGDLRSAQRLLDAAAERLERPYAAWETLTAMAEFGSSTVRERAVALLEPYRESSAPAFAATAAMVRALCAQRDGDTAERDSAASRARALYAAMGWMRHERRAAEFGAPQQEQRFSDREMQIAQLLQQGRSNRSMAAELFISEKTVEKHLARLYEKLQVNNRAAAVRALTQISIGG